MLAINTKAEKKNNPDIRREKGNGNSNAECQLSISIRAVEAEFTDMRFFYWRTLAKEVCICSTSIENCSNRNHWK